MRAIAFLVVVFATSGYCLPGGAPGSTCDNMTPQHGATPQANPSPYEIDISAFMSSDGDNVMPYYMPGEYYNITLRAMSGSNATFRGFLIQARTTDGTAVGTFSDPSANQPRAQLSNCVPPEVGVTHNQPSDAAERTDLQYVTFTWRAPDSGMTGAISFSYTTVQQFSTYWVSESTAMIQMAAGMPGGGGMPGGAASVTSLGVWALLATAVLTALKISF